MTFISHHVWRALLLAAGALLATGCNRQGNPQKEGERPSHLLRIRSEEDPYSLDPRTAGDRASQTVTAMLFEGLMRVQADGAPHPGAAESVELSPDGLVYTFKLRPCLWSNGNAVKASDFEYAWKKLLSPDFPSSFAYMLYEVEHAKDAKEGKVTLDAIGVTALDDMTLRVTLSHPAPYFLEKTASPVLAPVCQAVEERNPRWSDGKGEDYVCNGPFRVSSWEHRKQLSLCKNPLYWDASAVQLDGIEIMTVPDNRAALMLFRRGELDWIGDPLSQLPVDALDELKRQGELRSMPSSALLRFHFNVEKPPFDHPKMRRAFGLALDRASIVAHVMKAGEESALGLLPKVMAPSDEPRLPDHAWQEARTLFEEALADMHLERQQLPLIVMIYPNKYRQLAQVVQQQWKEALGVEIKLEMYEWNVYLDRIQHHDFQIAGLGWASDYNDPMSHLDTHRFRNLPYNLSGWENLRFSMLLDLADEEVDHARRQELLTEAERILLEEMPITPVYHMAHSFACKRNVDGVVYSKIGMADFKWTVVR